MHSSVSIGVVGNLNSRGIVIDSSTCANPSINSITSNTPNYSEFIWCSPNGGGVTDENYNTTDNYHNRVTSHNHSNELPPHLSPQNNSHSSYYDFHSHHSGISGNAAQNGASNRSGSEHHHSSPLIGHHYGGTSCIQMDTIASEAEECCSGGPEYYVTAARSPTDSAYEMWNCHNSASHANHDGVCGTSVGHPSPEDPLLVSPNGEGMGVGEDGGNVEIPRPTPRRRNTANKKERRRTMSINNAFADLRDCIPNVPADTKLSKIKTLRLATSYIAYLSEVLSGDDPSRTPAAFTAEISRKLARGDDKRKKELLMAELNNSNNNNNQHHHHNHSHSGLHDHRKTKGRTGWPQHVWALELQQ